MLRQILGDAVQVVRVRVAVLSRCRVRLVVNVVPSHHVVASFGERKEILEFRETFSTSLTRGGGPPHGEDQPLLESVPQQPEHLAPLVIVREVRGSRERRAGKGTVGKEGGGDIVGQNNAEISFLLHSRVGMLVRLDAGNDIVGDDDGASAPGETRQSDGPVDCVVHRRAERLVALLGPVDGFALRALDAKKSNMRICADARRQELNSPGESSWKPSLSSRRGK